ncbi:MAG: right-handed parallel beta-helix repeat-containing protein, partial [Lentisphaeria bacterium]|nr:right-handed parallel beta-helix repeat-containing protein [Lentisphaeria bacterium]NQZ67988.1 right-handed parallel beta-helix repeat-containing protein [Lentisphaeria bacterium]
LMPRDAILTTHNLTVRGETDDYDDVILDGQMEFDDSNLNFRTHIGAPALIKITHASHVTIANLTIANNSKYGILFFGDGRVNNLNIYNLKFHNNWARGLKGTNACAIDDQRTELADYDIKSVDHINYGRPHNGQVRYCLFTADTPKRNDQDGYDGDYIAGMDLMFLSDWTIADNTFIGIRGKNGGGRGAIFIWHDSENVRVENNHFHHCDRAISLGNPVAKERGYYHIQDSVVDQNTIIGGANFAIEVDYGKNIEITANKISSEIRTDYPAISVRDISDSALVKNNTIKSNGNEAISCDENVTLEENHLAEVLRIL